MSNGYLNAVFDFKYAKKTWAFMKREVKYAFFLRMTFSFTFVNIFTKRSSLNVREQFQNQTG